MLERLRWFSQSTILILNGKKIYIDPWEVPGDQPKADLILITHAHFDHCSPEDIKKLATPKTVVIGPPDCLEHVGYGKTGVNVKPGDVLSPLGFKIQVVPAYNVHPDRLSFHPKKNNWVGYILTVDGIKYYHAGDTDQIPDMKNLAPDVVFLPIGGVYTMDATEAAEAAKAINPSLACPVHYGKVPGVGKEEDAQTFVSLCEQKGVKAKILTRNV